MGTKGKLRQFGQLIYNNSATQFRRASNYAPHRPQYPRHEWCGIQPVNVFPSLLASSMSSLAGWKNSGAPWFSQQQQQQRKCFRIGNNISGSVDWIPNRKYTIMFAEDGLVTATSVFVLFNIHSDFCRVEIDTNRSNSAV